MLTIRAAGADDAPDLRALRLRALAEAPSAFGSTLKDEQALPADHWRELAVRSARADETVVFVAVDGVRWLGMAAGRWYDRGEGVAGLWGMWVDPEVRRFGAGARLVGAVHDWAAERGARVLRLGVVGGEPAAAFYARLGFVATGETSTLTRDPSVPAVFMARPV